MQSLTLGLVILAGLCFGSFVTLASYRLPLGKTLVKGRSQCPHCKTMLRAFDLVPVVSWLASGGRCRHCHAAIPPRYPIIELATAALFLVVYILYGLTPEAALLMLMSTALMVMLVVDLEHGIIPDQVHIALLVLGLAFRFQTGVPAEDIAAGFVVALIGALALYHGYYMVRGREGLGYGDVKFLAVAGVWLGMLPMLTFLLIAGLLGVLTGLCWRLRGKGDIFPFAPALAAAFWIGVVFPQVANYLINIAII